jgi:hypothetical protein
VTIAARSLGRSVVRVVSVARSDTGSAAMTLRSEKNVMKAD